MTALRNDHISKSFCGFYKFNETRTNCFHILIDDRVNRTTAFSHIPLETSDETDVLIRVHKKFHGA